MREESRSDRAVRHEDGHLKLLDPVELPSGTVINVTLDLPEPSEIERTRVGLLVRDLGAMKGRISRDEIYGEPA